MSEIDTETGTLETMKLLEEIVSSGDSNETARKETLIRYLPSIFPDDDKQSMLNAFSRGAEHYVDTLPSSVSEQEWGFIDTKIGQVIIEFKDDLTSDPKFEEAMTELKRYIAGLWTEKEVDSSFCCIASDVLRWKLYRPVPEESPDDGNYNADMVQLEKIEEIDASKANRGIATHLYHFMNRIFFEQNLKEITSKNLKADFGLETQTFRTVSEKIKSIVKEAREDPEPSLMMNLWEDTQEYVARVEGEFDYDLYVKHLYLVILSRLLVAAHFSITNDYDIRTSDEELKQIIRGDYFRRRLFLENFVERDFFGWITDDPWLNKFLPIARILFHNLLSYDFSKVPGKNILRLVYDEMMPEEQRDILGQRSTPEWLSNKVVNNTIEEDPPYSVLDPACGSGNFILSVLNQTRNRINEVPDSDLLDKLIESMTAIDVDPIAVIISKANWALALSDLIPHAQNQITIPVYNADSLFIARDLKNQESSTEHRTAIHFDNQEIDVPSELFLDLQAFDKLISWSYEKSLDYSNKCREKEIDVQSFFEEKIVSKLKENIESLLEDNEIPDFQENKNQITTAGVDLIKSLTEKILSRRDGVWAFVIRNSHRPSLLVGRFDYLVGNLPWLAMSKLPDIPYKKSLEQTTDYFDISASGSSFLHTEIATPFLLHSVYYFLRDYGKAGFVLPRTIYDGDHHHKFRQLEFSQKVDFKVDELWDFNEVDSLFDYPAIAMFGTKESVENQEVEIPTVFFEEDNGNLNQEEGNIVLAELEDKNAWIRWTGESNVIRAHQYYGGLFREGADLMPRVAVFVDALHDDGDSPMVEVITSDATRRNPYIKKLADECFQGRIERKYLYYTVTSNHLLPFLILEDHYSQMALPVEKENGNPQVYSQQELLDRNDRGIYEWLKAINEKLDEPISERIDKRNKLTNQNFSDTEYLVHYGAGGGHPCAGVQYLGEENPDKFLADQTTYFASIDTKQEAYYLMGLINCPIISEIIEPFQAKGDFGSRHIHKLVPSVIPKFKEDNETHNQLSQRAMDLEQRALQELDESLTDLAKPVASRRRQLRGKLEEEVASLNSLATQVFDESQMEDLPE